MPTALPSLVTDSGIPDSWKRWIGENKLQKSSDTSIIETLTRHGFSLETAAAEVQRASGEPYLQAGEWNTQRLRKAESLLAVYRSLSKLRPQADRIEKRSNVSRQELLEQYYASNRPVILQGLMTNWKALSSWTPEYLKHVVGNEEIEVMVGRNSDPDYELNCLQHRCSMRFLDYVDLVYNGTATNDYYLVANNDFFRRPAVQKLFKDIEAFPEYLDRSRLEGHVFFWFGPAGTVTPLHHDTSNIFMAQVLGRKRLKLIPSGEAEYVYNELGVHSRVDCDVPDYARWPLFQSATILEVDLAPGEVLFLPVGWWHHVRSLDVSLTISFTNFIFPNHYEWQLPEIRK